ncbi:transposase, partial [Ectothiorhodospira sp. PHS-1]|uniref:RNA-guided endonuclease InsQ/TnpB family protein n=1 Tax=Ectothiorhodospira sp. PHS-1 TaxID=519989 RepID=UPI00024A8481
MTDAAKTVIKSLSVRVKDRHAKVLDRMAFEVNQVWNLANEMAYEAWHVPVPEVGWIQGVWLHPFDIQKALAGINKARGWLIGSATIQEVIAVHGKSRKQFKKSKLRWRVSGGPRRSLGWIPFKSRAARFEGGKVRFAGESFGVWDSYGLENFKFRAGSFSQDARGRWYFNVQVEVAAQERSEGRSAVGIDLGLKDVATCSDGGRLSATQPYRTLERELGIAQRAGKKKRIKAIHAKIKHRRKDAIHKFSSMLVERHGAIFVGNVSSVSLAKTRMAKSVLDAGWGM